MLDIKFVRENPEAVRENIRKKFQDAKLPLVDEAIDYDARLRAAITEANELRAARNALSKQVGMLMGQAKKDPSKLAEAEAVKAQVKAAVNAGLTAEEIQEAIYQCAPYIGFSKALAAADKMNEALREKKAALPKSVATVTEADRGEKGFLTQKSIFPAGLDGMYQSSPENRKHVAEYLASMCFGDFYTRGALDIKTREILTLCIISAQGGCESQVKSHVQANFNVGNDETTMIEAITQCLPYMGFPRTLNALGCVAEVAGQQK